MVLSIRKSRTKILMMSIGFNTLSSAVVPGDIVTDRDSKICPNFEGDIKNRVECS